MCGELTVIVQNANIRKRRAYGYDEISPDPVFPGLPYPPSTVGISWSPGHQYIPDQGPAYIPPAPSSFDITHPESQQYVLQQAALILNRPVDDLLSLSGSPLPIHDNRVHSVAVDDDHRHLHKKLRLSPESQMAPSYPSSIPGPSAQEKTSLSGETDRSEPGRRSHGFHPPRSPSSGWTGSRLAECFANFSVCSSSVCSPFGSQPCMFGSRGFQKVSPTATRSQMLTCSPAYSPLLESGSFDYDNPQLPAMSTATVVSVQPQSQGSLLASPVTPDSDALFACDDPAMVAQFLSDYPPLQPERVMSFQPAIGKEAMVYPEVAAVPKTEGTETSALASSNIMQLSPYVADVSTQSSMPGPYSVSNAPSPYDCRSTMMSISSRFPQPGGFGLGLDTKTSAPQESAAPASLDYVPTHKTTPAKRGPFKDQDSREKTALTRKMGSCIRCRMQRIRVGPGGFVNCGQMQVMLMQLFLPVQPRP
jgi:hypothetical protein